MGYTHITKEQRYKIQSWLELFMPQDEIAARLGKDEGSVSREISRNKNASGKYTAGLADKTSRRRRKESGPGNPFRWRSRVARISIRHLLVR